MPVPTIQTHEVRFSTRGSRADARASCTCGWFTFGALHEVQAAASCHDTEWEAVEVDAPEPAVAS